MDRPLIGVSMIFFSLVSIAAIIVAFIMPFMGFPGRVLFPVIMIINAILIIPAILLLMGAVLNGLDDLLLPASLLLLLGYSINAANYETLMFRRFSGVSIQYEVTAIILLLVGWLLFSLFLALRIKGATAITIAILIAITELALTSISLILVMVRPLSITFIVRVNHLSTIIGLVKSISILVGGIYLIWK